MVMTKTTKEEQAGVLLEECLLLHQLVAQCTGPSFYFTKPILHTLVNTLIQPPTSFLVLFFIVFLGPNLNSFSLLLLKCHTSFFPICTRKSGSRCTWDVPLATHLVRYWKLVWEM
ncbi:hypothetical protein KC19_VG097500 [Ceratodon purpureus]|uniref:Uncharacterized protein n=1 Tax=Ceratodon purpureus TaxID=3225 RepID=A0A8T0HP87_CERPU|nr:hypothetical protein KC19_VG097500 [Ceratodon purpureus]